MHFFTNLKTFDEAVTRTPGYLVMKRPFQHSIGFLFHITTIDNIHCYSVYFTISVSHCEKQKQVTQMCEQRELSSEKVTLSVWLAI
jgi:hypothetical protein